MLVLVIMAGAVLEMKTYRTIKSESFASIWPFLQQPIGLPLVTNGPDNVVANDNNEQKSGRHRGRGPI